MTVKKSFLHFISCIFLAFLNKKIEFGSKNVQYLKIHFMKLITIYHVSCIQVFMSRLSRKMFDFFPKFEIWGKIISMIDRRINKFSSEAQNYAC